jgi:glutathione S-transferase
MATKTSQPLHLYTAITPNGVVPAIYLEELKRAYPDKASLLDFSYAPL